MITAMGEALIDIIVDTRGEVTSMIGGAPVNTARTIARLGVPATFLGGLSSDAFGQRIMRLLNEDGVALALAERVEEPTTLAIATLDESGAATYRFLMDGTSSAVVTPAMARARLDPDCRALHVGTLGLVLEPLASATVSLVDNADDAQIVMLDPNCRPSVLAGSRVFRETLDSVAARADVIKVSGDDLDFLFPEQENLPAAVALQKQTGAVVLFTDGAHAVHVLGLRGDFVIDVPKVPVVDTVGAGDSFSGGFLAYWMHEGLGRRDLADSANIAAAARFGIAVAGITCQRAGADPPYAHEVPGGWL